MSSHWISSEALTAQLYCPWSCLQGSSQRWLVGVEGLLAGNSHFTLDVIQNLILIATDILSLAMKLLGAHVCVCMQKWPWCWGLCVQQFGVFFFVSSGKTEGTATWIMRRCKRILLTEHGIHHLSHGNNQKCVYFCIWDKFLRCFKTF